VIRSMTGFGRGEVESDGHRFLNTNVRLPREFDHLESRVAAICGERCERGHLNVRIEIERSSGGEQRGPRIERPVLDHYLALIESLEGLRSVRAGVSAEALLGLPGVVSWEAEPIALAEEQFMTGARAALELALVGVVASREREGRALEEDLRQRLTAIESRRARLAELAPAREERERARLHDKVRLLLDADGDEIERRIEQEIVLLADRVDVSEELTRMGSHLEHFAAELSSTEGSVGRKLTFLLQELGREANTIGAKANDPEMQQAAIEIKAELEKMREQAENVE